MDWKTLFLSADGRIGRKEFWIGFAILFAASVVLNMLPVIGQIIGLLLIWPQVCITAKRLHDMGRTGWLMLVPVAVAIVCSLIASLTVGASLFSAAILGSSGTDMAAAGSALAGVGAASAVMGVALLVYLAFLLWIGLTPSQEGMNRFDPATDSDPSAPKDLDQPPIVER